MVLRYFNTRQPFHRLRDEMDRLFDGFSGHASDWPWSGPDRPAVDVWESDDAIFVEMEVPGLKGDHLDMSVVGNELSIKVDRPDLREEGVTYHRRERPVGSFGRVLRLPAEVDSQRVEAELRHGVLTLTLPKAEAAKPRKIEVNGS